MLKLKVVAIVGVFDQLLNQVGLTSYGTTSSAYKNNSQMVADLFFTQAVRKHEL